MGQKPPEHVAGDSSLSVPMVGHGMSLAAAESGVGPGGRNGEQRTAEGNRETKRETCVHGGLL